MLDKYEYEKQYKWLDIKDESHEEKSHEEESDGLPPMSPLNGERLNIY